LPTLQIIFNKFAIQTAEKFLMNFSPHTLPVALAASVDVG
jgi:hypothetical protein